jgi:hypothetical protein
VPTLAGLAVPLDFMKLDLGDIPIRTMNVKILMVELGGGANEHWDAKARDQLEVAKAQDLIMGGDLVGGDNKDCNDNVDGNRGQAGIIQININMVWDGNFDVMLQAMLTKLAKLTFGVKHIKLSG